MRRYTPDYYEYEDDRRGRSSRNAKLASTPFHRHPYEQRFSVDRQPIYNQYPQYSPPNNAEDVNDGSLYARVVYGTKSVPPTQEDYVTTTPHYRPRSKRKTHQMDQAYLNYYGNYNNDMEYYQQNYPYQYYYYDEYPRETQTNNPYLYYNYQFERDPSSTNHFAGSVATNPRRSSLRDPTLPARRKSPKFKNRGVQYRKSFLRGFRTDIPVQTDGNLADQCRSTQTFLDKILATNATQTKKKRGRLFSCYQNPKGEKNGEGIEGSSEDLRLSPSGEKFEDYPICPTLDYLIGLNANPYSDFDQGV